MSNKVGDETIRNVNLVEIVDPLLGQVVEQYRIESFIGSGAMGIVYRGVHQVIGKAAAIKVLKLDFADDPEMVERLIREARTVNAIRHPAIVDIFGFGKLPRSDQPYIVMDLIEGEPLDTFIKKHAPMRPRQVIAMLDELLSALSAAHAVGVIHRDLKPGNVFVESKPDGKLGIKVIDFGLAKQADRAGGSVKPTNPGTLLGTPAFMAPEQVLGNKVTPVTDLYAVGGIAYQMLTAHLPHEGTTAIEVITAKMKGPPAPPRTWQSNLDAELEGWVMNLLEREPADRMQSADEARRTLKRVNERLKAITGSVPGNQTPRPRATGTGVVPKRDWGEAKTMETDARLGPSAAEVSTDGHASPFATPGRQLDETLPDSEPTAPPMESPFHAKAKAPSRRNLPPVPVQAGLDSEITKPPMDVDVTPQPVPVLVPEPVPDAASQAPTEPGREAVQPSAPSRTGLYVGLGLAVLALLAALAVLLSSQ